MNVHLLKTEKRFFQSSWEDKKLWEIRKNDRDFRQDDIVILWEFEFEQIWSKRFIIGYIDLILTDIELKDVVEIQKDFCIFSVKILYKIDLDEEA